ncbi:MAG: hypothetical protein KDB61_10345, partial [Planctomycetes bacterium]|nr:hypothetical protein [Planctomycetota bacterium]
PPKDESARRKYVWDFGPATGGLKTAEIGLPRAFGAEGQEGMWGGGDAILRIPVVVQREVAETAVAPYLDNAGAQAPEGYGSRGSIIRRVQSEVPQWPLDAAHAQRGGLEGPL